MAVAVDATRSVLRGIAKVAAAILILWGIVILVGWMARAHRSNVIALTPNQVVFNDSLIVPHGESRGCHFTLNSPAVIDLDIQGIADIVKGFDVRFLDEANYNLFTNHKPHNEIGSLSDSEVTSKRQSDLLQPGTYYIMIQNRYNLLKSCNVHVLVKARAATVSP